MNNTAIVGFLRNIRKIPDRDRIVLCDVVVNNVPQASVIVGIDTKENSKVVYFTNNMCLNESTILKEYPDLGKYLGKSGRVKTLKLKDTISDGLAVEVEKFYKWEKESFFTEGTEFLDLDGINICSRYVPPVKIQSIQGQKKGKKGKINSRMIPGLFHFHIDTDNILRNLHKINPDDVISISDKKHGSSWIIGNIPVKRKLSFIEKIAKVFGCKIIESEYDYIYASRTVVKNAVEDKVHNHFYGEDLYKECTNQFRGKLRKGETLYGEVFGYLKSGKMIQKNYDYGCEPYTHKVQVYRITQTNEDGEVIELGWKSMIDRCQEIGVEPVETFFFGRARDYVQFNEESVEEWRIKFLEALKENFFNRRDKYCKNKVWSEGVVIRKEGYYIESYKLKDPLFLAAETATFESGEQDIEEEA